MVSFNELPFIARSLEAVRVADTARDVVHPTAHALRVNFVHPHEFFDPARYDASGSVGVCPRPGAKGGPFPIGHMCHFVRNTERTVGDVDSRVTSPANPEGNLATTGIANFAEPAALERQRDRSACVWLEH